MHIICVLDIQALQTVTQISDVFGLLDTAIFFVTSKSQPYWGTYIALKSFDLFLGGEGGGGGYDDGRTAIVLVMFFVFTEFTVQYE